MVTDIDKLEEELRQELAQIESIFEDGGINIPEGESMYVLSPSISKKVSNFDLAIAEGDEEDLKDQLRAALSKIDILSDEKKQLIKENEELLNKLKLKDELLMNSNNHILTNTINTNDDNNDSSIDKGEAQGVYNALEFRLAETRSKFARSSQMLEDQMLANKNLERDLSYEIELRKHAEKERDAYMAAYEASIKHFEKFAAKRGK